jgi:cystathionine beta-lyase
VKETTQILHSADTPGSYFGAVNPPVFHASLFGFETYQEFLEASQAKNTRPFYNRNFNPTVNLLEQKIAVLEHAEAGIAFSSGMGAITAALLTFLSQGDHILIADTVYGPTRQFCNQVLARLGIQVEYFSAADTANLAGRLQDNSRLIYLETPGSLTFELHDLCAVARLARQRGIYTVADNSWATPIFQKPLEMGIDVVVHTGTKYLGGHSDLTLGLIACSAEHFAQIKPMAVLLGATLAPDDAYLALRSLRTLALRMTQHQSSGFALARWLQNRPEVRQVLHPGLPEFPGHDLAERQQTGYSGLFSFRLQPGTDKARHAFVDALDIFRIGVLDWFGRSG